MKCLSTIALALLLPSITLLISPPAAEAQPIRRKTVNLPAAEGRQAAIDFPANFEWLGTEQKLSLAGNLKGHVVLLDFWTYCCINCLHILPDLEYLEHKYAGKPVMVIGVHSAKFETESKAKNILQAMGRYRIEHPVLVDQEHAVWQNFGIRAWPSFAIIDSQGRVVGQVSGEGKRELLDQVIGALLEEGEKDGTLAKDPLVIKHKPALPGMDQLAYPGKITADPANKRLFISDSNHDRLIAIGPDGKHQMTIGAGVRGFKDGSLAEAQFFNPQGIAVDGDILYVADTDNHAIRKVDLKAGTVTTIIGTGKQTYDPRGGKVGVEQGINSPWDVIVHEGRLLIAMAGQHQLWEHNPKTGVSQAWTGTGGENIIDGFPNEALLAQPSGLAIHGDWLYFADSEVSAVRRARLNNGAVETLIGKGLFVFGFEDGRWNEARLQHALGLAVLDGKILVADTYNDAIRSIDLESATISTVLGKPDSGDLDEPSGLAVLDGMVYITDTNHHRIVRFDPKSNQATPLDVRVPVK